METHFLASGNHFLPLSQIFFKKFFFPTTGTRFFMPEEKYCFLLRTLFTAGGNHYLNYREAYSKLLSLLLATIFFDFLDVSAKAVFHVFLNKFSIPARGIRFSVNLKQYSFIWRFFSASRYPLFEK